MSNVSSHRNITFILPSLSSGGAERVIITYMNGLDRECFKPSLITVQDKGELRELVEEDIDVYCLKLSSVWLSITALYKILGKLKPDLVVSTMAHMNFVVLLLRPFFKKTKFIVREAITPSFFFEKHKAFRFVIKALYRQLYPKADLVLSPSTKVFEEFEELGVRRENFQLLRNPVDTQKLRQKTTFTNITEDRKQTVYFVGCGRLEPQKGFDRLIEALAQAEMKIEWRLDIVGEGRERQNLEALIIKHGFEDRIKLTGLIPRPYAYFGQADCFVLPSRYEGLPNVVLEALACGTPVISTRESGGIQEIAEHTSSDTVKIVDTMGDFIYAMNQVKPMPTDDYRASLLPEVFEKEKLLEQFQGILTKVLDK